MLVNCQWINTKSIGASKLEHCPNLREGEGSITGTFGLKKSLKSLKIDIFVSVCDNSGHKRDGKQKYSGLLRITY